MEQQNANIKEGQKPFELDTLLLQQQESDNPQGKDLPKVKEDWFYHWDNTHRVKIVMHADVYNKLKENKEREDLVVKEGELKTSKGSEGAPYMLYSVIIPSSVVATF